MKKLITPIEVNAILQKLVKNKNIFYAMAKSKRIKNRKLYDETKLHKKLQKQLSKENFTQYIKEKFKDDK